MTKMKSQGQCADHRRTQRKYTLGHDAKRIFVFSRQCFEFIREAFSKVLRSLAKALKHSFSSHLILFQSKMFCVGTKGHTYIYIYIYLYI